MDPNRHHDRSLASPERAHRWYAPVKRVADVVLAALALVLLSPVFAAVGLLVYRDLGSPVIFRQVRPGRDARPFTLFKFRTMATGECEGVEAVSTDDERTSRLGHILRRTSLDELPELVNILRGDMSFVGPRPMLMEYVALFTPEQARRHQVRPGLTGLAQVSGRNALSWEERFALDVEYVDHYGPWLDLKVLAATALVVLSKRGAHGDADAVLEPFRGSAK